MMHLPVGTSNFRKLIEYKDPDGKGYLFVDKSLLIKESMLRIILQKTHW